MWFLTLGYVKWQRTVSQVFQVSSPVFSSAVFGLNLPRVFGFVFMCKSRASTTLDCSLSSYRGVLSLYYYHRFVPRGLVTEFTVEKGGLEKGNLLLTVSKVCRLCNRCFHGLTSDRGVSSLKNSFKSHRTLS